MSSFLQPTRLLCPWDFPGENTGVGCHFLLWGIFPTHCIDRRILYLQATRLFYYENFQTYIIVKRTVQRTQSCPPLILNTFVLSSLHPSIPLSIKLLFYFSNVYLFCFPVLFFKYASKSVADESTSKTL